VGLYDLNDPFRPIATGLSLRVTANGGKTAFTLTEGDKLLFSSDWSGAKTQEIPLTQGKINVR
jgi:hypothetical protein